MKKYKFIVLNILFLFFAFNIASAESLEISFVDKLRYSQDSFFAGEDIRVYATLQNNSGFDLQGIIYFDDNEKFIGDFNFFIADGRNIETWVDWRPSEGEHNLLVKISNLKKLEIAKVPKEVVLDEEIITTKKIDIDIDTDKDGIGNKEDLDDDNDNISDKKEIEQGTNTLVFNEVVVENIEPKTETKANLNDSIETETKKIITGDIMEDLKSITEATLEKSKDLTGTTKNFLEKHKETIDEEIDKDKKIELAQKELQESSENLEVKEGVNLYTANILDAVPSVKEMYSFILGILIYILNTWWLLLATIGLIFWLLYKYFRHRMMLRRF